MSSRRAGSSMQNLQMHRATNHSTTSVSMPADRSRNGVGKDGYTRTIHAAGSNGTAGTTWGDEYLTRMPVRSTDGKRSDVTCVSSRPTKPSTSARGSNAGRDLSVEAHRLLVSGGRYLLGRQLYLCRLVAVADRYRPALCLPRDATAERRYRASWPCTSASRCARALLPISPQNGGFRSTRREFSGATPNSMSSSAHKEGDRQRRPPSSRLLWRR
jgi:hypothetical protein